MSENTSRVSIVMLVVAVLSVLMSTTVIASPVFALVGLLAAPKGSGLRRLGWVLLVVTFVLACIVVTTGLNPVHSISTSTWK